MKTLIPYYRGIPLSMIHDVKVSVDGQEVERKDILFTLDNKYFFTLDEMETVTSFKWEYGNEATVIVKKDGLFVYGEDGKVALGATDNAVIEWMKLSRNSKTLALIRKDTYQDVFED